MLFCQIMIYHFMGIKPLDSGLWSGEWSLDVGRATLGECHTRLISLLSWVTSVKKNFRRSGMNMCRSNTTFSRTLNKNLEGKLVTSTGIPRGGVWGSNPPLNIQKKFVLCVRKIYSKSPALVFIKSKILYRKTLEIVR